MHTPRMPSEPSEPSERTSVTLPSSLAHRLSYEARRTARSASAVVRDALTHYFADAQEPQLPSFVGIGRSGHADTSVRVDEVVDEVMEGSAERILGGQDPE